MEKLFVEKSIDIHTNPEKVWRVLTEPSFTKRWVGEFWISGYIDSEWEIGSPVHWKDDNEKVLVSGDVIALKPFQFLHFSVIDEQSDPAPEMDETDGITYDLFEMGDITKLTVTQGDFGKIPDGEKYYVATVDIWDRLLPKIKELAEAEFL